MGESNKGVCEKMHAAWDMDVLAVLATRAKRCLRATVVIMAVNACVFSARRFNPDDTQSSEGGGGREQRDKVLESRTNVDDINMSADSGHDTTGPTATAVTRCDTLAL
jgi:hypothetical protein